MKKTEEKRPAKSTTTNYPPDSHKKFCERCLKHNRVCPMTGTVNISKYCSV